MPRMRSLVPTILAVVVAALSPVERVARAGDNCLGRPNATAAQGEHWHYRLNHATHRKCWYLGSKDARVVRRAVVTTRHTGARGAAPRQAPPASAQRVAQLAPPSPETADVVTPAGPAETLPEGAFVSSPAGEGDVLSDAPDVQQVMRVPDLISDQPKQTIDETPAQPTRQAAPAERVTIEHMALREALAAIAVFLAVVGVVLIGAARRAFRCEVSAQAVVDAVRATSETGIAAVALKCEIDQISLDASDTTRDIKQSLQQLLPVRQRELA